MTVAARILTRAVAEQWGEPVLGLNGKNFHDMTKRDLRQAAADLARELAVMRRAWAYAAPGICAGHIQLAGEPALPPKPQPPAITEES